MDILKSCKHSKTGVYRAIHCFLNFALKHRLWVLVRKIIKYKILTANCHFTFVKIAACCMGVFA